MLVVSLKGGVGCTCIGFVTSKCCDNLSGVTRRRGGVHLYWGCKTISVGGVSREG